MAPKMANLHAAARRAFSSYRPDAGLTLSDPPLPIDDKAGGCDTGESSYRAWTRETPPLPLEPEDLISDKGNEIHRFRRERGIGDLFIMGVHTNVCVLNRTFAIKQMTKWGSAASSCAT